VGLFEPALLRASWNLEIDRLLADAGYDSEPNPTAWPARAWASAPP
jgi:hypothetical protein